MKSIQSSPASLTLTEPQAMSPPGAQLSKQAVIDLALTIHGWMVEEELSWLYDQATKMHSIVEIGSWMGRSTTVLCHACPGTVYAVDHWRPEEPRLLNIIRRGMYVPAAFKLQMQPFLDSGKLILIHKNSLLAAADPTIPDHPDMVFIDGEHDLVNVRRDLFHWANRPKKLLCGHDYFTDGLDPAKYNVTMAGYPDVKKAVDAQFGSRVQIVAGTIWAIPKMRGLSC